MVEKRGEYAYFRFFGHKIANILKMESTSLLACLGALYTFGLLLRQLAPGVRAASRNSYCVLLLALAPVLVQAGLFSLNDSLGLWLYLSAALLGIQAKLLYRVLALPFFALALITRGWLTPYFCLDCSFWNLFSNTFEKGALQYYLPNILYVFIYPVVYYGFFPLLGLLWVFFRRTDVYRAPQRFILGCLIAHVLYIALAPRQCPMDLLPDYALLLALLFPAWDRIYAYGFHFVGKKRMYWALGAFLLVQLLGNVVMWRP